jgi:hypothetical protein
MAIIIGSGDLVDQRIGLIDQEDATVARPSLEAMTLHSYPDPAIEASWRRYALAERYPSQYLAPEFFLEPFFASRKPFAILLLKDERVVAVVSGTHEKTHLRCGNSGSPQLSISPECTEDDLALLVEALRAETSGRMGISIASFSNSTGLGKHGFFQRTGGATMMLDLRNGSEALYKQFSKGRRSDIQFAIKAGVEVTEASSETDFEIYYEIYRDWCARKQIAQHDRELMLRALRLRSNRRLFLAKHKGKVIAGTIIRFLENGIAEYAANNSPEQYQSLRANPLLNWVAIEWACNQGLNSFSMCGSHPYLRHFGGQEIPIYRYSADASFLKTFQVREWLIKKRQAYKESRQSTHD